MPFLLKVFVNEAKQRLFIPKAIFFSTIYFFLGLFLLNFKSFESIILQSFDFYLKLTTSFLLFFETVKVIGSLEVILLVISSLLFGLNLELVLRKIKLLRKKGSLHLVFGAGILSLVAAGCAGCGLSIASVIGIAGAVALLPMQGVELLILSIAILLFSLWYNVATLVKVCKIEKTSFGK